MSSEDARARTSARSGVYVPRGTCDHSLIMKYISMSGPRTAILGHLQTQIKLATAVPVSTAYSGGGALVWMYLLVRCCRCNITANAEGVRPARWPENRTALRHQMGLWLPQPSSEFLMTGPAG